MGAAADRWVEKKIEFFHFRYFSCCILAQENQKPDSVNLESGLTAIWVCNTAGRLLIFYPFRAVPAGL